MQLLFDVKVKFFLNFDQLKPKLERSLVSELSHTPPPTHGQTCVGTEPNHRRHNSRAKSKTTLKGKFTQILTKAKYVANEKTITKILL